MERVLIEVAAFWACAVTLGGLFVRRRRRREILEAQKRIASSGRYDFATQGPALWQGATVAEAMLRKRAQETALLRQRSPWHVVNAHSRVTLIERRGKREVL